MKQFPIIFNSLFLCVVLQFCTASADVFTTTNKNIRIEVIDYRDCLDDILFWIYQKDTPVLPQKLINNGIYPISVTIYNDSDTSIKIMKNAIGGLSTVQGKDVAQLYQYNTGSQIVKKAAVGAVIGLMGMMAVNVVAELNATLAAWKASLINSLRYSWHVEFEQFCFCGGGLCAALMQLPEVKTVNALISQTVQSQILSEESIVAPGSSMSFILFASHSPSGHTLKVPVLDEQDNQVVSFLCSFGSIVAQ